MGTQARVTSVEALDSFRASLVVFVTKARQSVDGVRDRVRRTKNRLQTDLRMHWEGEIRRRRRILDQVQQELYSARLSGLTETVTMRQAVVRKVKATVDEAEEKLRNVKAWNRNFDGFADPLMKKLDSFREYLDHEMPDAITFLYRTREILDAYAEKSTPADKPAPTEPPPTATPEP